MEANEDNEVASIGFRLSIVKEKILNISKFKSKEVCLVAVSKTKPISMIIEAYNHGQKHFGENYVMELYSKANDSEIMEKCPDIKWHLIGHLQSNKVNKLTNIPNLYMVQTIDSIKLSDALNRAWSTSSVNKSPLKIMIQINISEESGKSGVLLPEVNCLVRHILEKCHHLVLVGLMIIGTPNFDSKFGPNPEFLKLLNVRDEVCSEFNLQPEALTLSMGMSHDYEHAIELGSTCVRIGSAIFGSRASKF